MSFMIEEDDADEAVRSLHAAFFQNPEPVDLRRQKRRKASCQWSAVSINQLSEVGRAIQFCRSLYAKLTPDDISAVSRPW